MKNIIDQLAYEDNQRKKKKRTWKERNNDFDEAVKKFNEKFNKD